MEKLPLMILEIDGTMTNKNKEFGIPKSTIEDLVGRSMNAEKSPTYKSAVHGLFSTCANQKFKDETYLEMLYSALYDAEAEIDYYKGFGKEED